MLKKIAITLLTITLFTNPAFAETWQEAIPNAKEVGQGEFRWLFFDVYSAKLWSENVPFDINKSFALQLTYHRKITGEEFVKTTIDEIKRIFGSTYSEEVLKIWAEKLSNVFPTVNKGDQLIGVYVPNRGCLFFDSKKRLAEINDPELAKAFFAIWLDERSRDKSLRANLLGK